MKYYIAYGSNLNKRQMLWRCPGACPVGTTWLEGYRLVFQGRPIGAHANVIPAKGHRVPVAIWEITDEDEKKLDIYEGVKGGYYTKEYMPVYLGSEQKEALIYIMTPNPYGYPDDGYLYTIDKGYKDFCIDPGFLEEAVKYTGSKIHEERKRYHGDY